MERYLVVGIGKTFRLFQLQLQSQGGEWSHHVLLSLQLDEAGSYQELFPFLFNASVLQQVSVALMGEWQDGIPCSSMNIQLEHSASGSQAAVIYLSETANHTTTTGFL